MRANIQSASQLIEQAGLLSCSIDKEFQLQESVERLLDHFMTRERWAIAQLRRHRILTNIPATYLSRIAIGEHPACQAT
jgi:hypothetical protein